MGGGRALRSHGGGARGAWREWGRVLASPGAEGLCRLAGSRFFGGRKLFSCGVELAGGGVMMAYVIGCAEVLSLLSVCESEQLPAVCAPTRGVSVHSQLCLCVTGCVWVCVHQLCTSFVFPLVVPMGSWLGVTSL